MKNICSELKCNHLSTSNMSNVKEIKNDKVLCIEHCPKYYPASYLCCYSCKRKVCNDRAVKYHKIPFYKVQNFLIFERFEKAP